MKNLIAKYPLVLVFLVYLLANGLMVISPGVWWDDWTIFNPDIEVLKHQFITGGQPHFAAFHIWAAQHIPMDYVPQFYHSLSFVSGALCLWMTWSILKWFRLDRSWVIGISLLVASSPLFSARISMACIMYYTSSPLFLLGVVLFLQYLRSGMTGWRVGAFIAFLASLAVWLTAIALIPAFLILMAVYVEPKPAQWRWSYVRLIVKRLVGWLELVLLPVFAMVIRSLWMAPTEVYADSYELGLSKLIKLPIVLLQSFIDSTIGYLGQCFSIPVLGLGNVAIAIVLVGGLTWLVYKTLRSYDSSTDPQHGNHLLWIGLWLYFPAILATSSMGAALFNTFNSRYQALLLIPVALLLFWSILQWRTPAQRRIVLGLVVGTSVLANIYTQLQFQKSWIKSCAIIQIIKNDPTLHNPYTNVIVADHLSEFNPYGGTLDYYVFTGLSKWALTGDQSHFYTDKKLINTYFTSPIRKVILNTLYNCKKSKDISTMHYKLTLEEGETKLSMIKTLKLTYLYYKDRNAFERELPSVINYEIIPLAQANSGQHVTSGCNKD